MSDDEVRIGELFDSFLRKPVTSHELTESLEEYLQSEQHSGKVRGMSNFSLSERDHEFLKKCSSKVKSDISLNEWWEICQQVSKAADENEGFHWFYLELKERVEHFDFPAAVRLFNEL